MAQDSANVSQQQKDQQGLGDIVVTANRTASAAQETPTALNAYSSDQLRDQGIASVRDLTTIDPSVNLTNSSGAAYVAVRGIASTDVTEVGDPSVPIARDGFFTNRSFSINSSMYDLERIEVLKGPQGTLNGRNSTGGLISIITKRPEFKNGGYATVDVGNYGTFNSEMGVNVKLTDTLAIRASGTYQHHDGYRKSDGPARYGDDEDFASGRIQARYESGPLSIWASYQHDSRKVNGDALFSTTLGGPKPDFGDAKVYSSSVPTGTTLTGDRVRWEMSYVTDGNLNFIYSGGYDKQKWHNVLDSTGPVYPANRQFIQNEAPATWNHEFRISNDKNSRLFFQVGYFRFTEDNTVNSGLFNREMTGDYAVGGSLENLGQPDTYAIKFDYGLKTRSQAIFGQVNYDLTDTLQLSLGGRYTWDKKERTGQAVLNYPALAYPEWVNAHPDNLVGTSSGLGHMSESQPTWHAGLNYRPTLHTLVYAKYDRGYKSGGFNSNGSKPVVPYGPEKLDAFEVGTKNTLLGNTLQVNADAFYFNYRGYQASQQSDALNGAAGVFNVGSATIYGVEGDVKALLEANTRLGFNATWLHTKFGDGIEVANGAGNVIDISGNQLPNAPKLTLTASLDHDFMLSRGKITARVDGKYSSSFYYSVFNLPDVESDSYFLTNASLGYEDDNGWKIQLYVRNIFNKQVLANASQNYVSHLDIYQFQPPRTFGVRGSVNF